MPGIAIAQAPEAGVGICFGEDAANTISCAQTRCMDESDLDVEDCTVNLWCLPRRWVADIFMQHQEGIHWHSFVCDATDWLELEALVATKRQRRADRMQHYPDVGRRRQRSQA